MESTRKNMESSEDKTGMERIIEEVVQFMQRIRYGEVIIIIHDSEVVQIEKVEKKRFQK